MNMRLSAVKSKAGEKRGMLKKKSPKLFVGRQQRYFEISERIFKYFKEVKGVQKCKGTLNFDIYQCFVQ